MMLICFLLLASGKFLVAETLISKDFHVKSDFSQVEIIRCFLSKDEISNFSQQLSSNIYSDALVLVPKRNGYKLYGLFEGTAYLSYQLAYDGPKAIKVTASPMTDGGANILSYNLSLGDNVPIEITDTAVTKEISIGSSDIAYCGSMKLGIRTEEFDIDYVVSYSAEIKVEVSNI